MVAAEVMRSVYRPCAADERGWFRVFEKEYRLSRARESGASPRNCSEAI